MREAATKKTIQFARDVLAGLSGAPRSLSSKYFYDDAGSQIFREIMQLDEYYLTDCEREIFEACGRTIFRMIAAENGPFDLMELGAGDGSKTAVLIEQFLSEGADLTYAPIDISPEALAELSALYRSVLPELRLEPLNGDYFSMLRRLRETGGRRKVILFLGSNIGNFGRDDAIEFFCSLRSVMTEQDMLLTGFDLQKDPRIIAAAYDDAKGVTARFNLNLLTRINRELGGDFDVDKFSHYANYRPVEGAARSYLISRERQTVHIEALGRDFLFDEWEPVFTEVSRKYTVRMIDEIAQATGFAVKHHFFDSRRYYCDSLWGAVSP